MEYSGTDLLETFNKLGINTGNISKLTIDSWFDTDCEDTKRLLQWLCTSLGKENVLTAHENEEYEQLLESKSFLYGKQYEMGLNQIRSEFPGMLEYHDNLSDIEAMQDELEILKEELNQLEQQTILQENISKNLAQKLRKTMEEESLSILKKKEAEKKTVELGEQLDGIHEKLQKQINRYAVNLNEFQDTKRALFISNMPSVLYNQYHLEVVSYLYAFLRREFELLPKQDLTIKESQESASFIEIKGNQQEILRQRLFKNMQAYISHQLKEEMLKAELCFLENIDVNEILTLWNFNDRSSILLEANIISKEELLHCVCLNVEKLIQKVCNGHVDGPQINMIKNNIINKENKLVTLTKLDNKVTELLAKHILLFLFIKREKVDLQSADKFFRDVYHYITHNLWNCRQRTENMIDVINDYQIFKTTPLEEKLKISQVFKELLSNKDANNLNVFDLSRRFRNECNKIEQEIFVSDYEVNHKHLKLIGQETATMWKFLCMGFTNRVITIPKQLRDCFNKIEEMQNIHQTTLKSSMQSVGDAEKRLANKWLQMKRDMWVSFLFKPEKMLWAIEQVERAVEQQRNKM